MFLFSDPEPDDLLLDSLERLGTNQRDGPLETSSEKFTGEVSLALSHLCRSRGSTGGEPQPSGSRQRSKVGRRGVGGSVVESVGSHRALCSDSSWLRWSLEK